jgi:hypothetical protein
VLHGSEGVVVNMISPQQDIFASKDIDTDSAAAIDITVFDYNLCRCVDSKNIAVTSFVFGGVGMPRLDVFDPDVVAGHDPYHIIVHIGTDQFNLFPANNRDVIFLE